MSRSLHSGRPTLLGRLLRVQAGVAVASCGLFVLASAGSGAWLLRHNQNLSLDSLAAQLCHGIKEESREIGDYPTESARAFFQESAMSGFRFEYIDRTGTVLAAQGDLAPSGTPRTREKRCSEAHSIRVGTQDVLARPEVRLAGLGLLAALPLALLFGILSGRALLRRHLAQLVSLQTAAARLQPDGALTLGVNSETAELHDLEHAFDGLLGRLGAALGRERRFAQEASHELRTPLTVLRGRVESLGGTDPAALLEPIDSLDRLIGALLLMARSESAELPATPVNLCDIAREAARPPTEVVAPDEILVRGSEELLERAVGNLLENARKYAGQSARVRIEVSTDGADALIAVDDSGPGMPPELRPRAFERFVRGASATASSEHGAGLGLAVVQAIARRHGGSASTGPSPLGGERLTIRLPLLDSGSSYPVS